MRNRCGWWLFVVPLLWLVETEAFGHQPTVSQIAEIAAQALKLEQTGKFEEALPLRQKAYDLSVQVYGDKDRDTLTEVRHLAEAYKKEGQLAEALPLQKKACRLAEDTLGLQHSDTQALYLSTAATILDLASADERYAKEVSLAYHYLSALYRSPLEELGRNWVSNEHLSAVLEKAVRIKSNAVWGENEPFVLKGVYDLAMDHFDPKRLADALPWFERVQKWIEVREERFSAGQSLTDLATVYVVLGRPADALPLQERALKLRTDIYGADHPHIAAGFDDLAATYLDLGRRADALRQQEKVLKRYSELKSKYRLYEFDTIIRRYMSMDRLADFMSRFDKALALKIETIGETHPVTLLSLYELASEVGGLDGTPAALPLLERALSFPPQIDVERGQIIVSMLHRLAGYYSNLGRLPDALQVAEKAWKLASENMGSRHRETIISLSILSKLNFKDNRPDQGLTLLEQVLELETEVYGERNPNNAGSSTRSHLAYKYLEFGYASKALPLAKKELSLSTNSTNYYEITANLRILAEVFLALNRPADALPLLEDQLYPIVA